MNPLNLNRIIPAEGQESANALLTATSVHLSLRRGEKCFLSMLSARPIFSRPTLCKPIALASGLLLSVNSQANTLEEVVVTAAFDDRDANHRSVTVVSTEQMQARSAQHVEDLLSLAPNVNVASGASRGRFFQIRGIGERSQFVEPVNASVATLLDGIDITGIGGVATLWDLQQVEVLRGPQGTLFGANALAGLINLRSQSASNGDALTLQAGVENDNGRRLGLIAGSTLNSGLHGRIALQQYQSDGFINNTWLERNDTNNRDEFTGKLTLAYDSGDHSVELGIYRIDADNGYDAFSLDNTRQTLSDQPGRDSTTTNALRLYWQWRGDITLSNQLSHAGTETNYSYDEDWSFVGISPGWEYSSFDAYLRDRDMTSLESRLSGEWANIDWVGGVYLRREDENLTRNYTYLSTPFNSALQTDTGAIFTHLSLPISTAITAYGGLRWEYRGSEYQDSQGVITAPSDTLYSGRLGLEWQLSDSQLLYLSASRGVRAGGVNANLLASIDALAPGQQDGLRILGGFESESLVNSELGWRWRSSDATFTSDLTLFSMDRRDQQTKSSLVIPRSDGSTAFIDYTNNASQGTNRGLEWQLAWAASEAVTLRGALGWLDAKFDTYINAAGEDLAGREQPHAPRYTAHLALDWRPLETLTLGFETTAMDSFYFSDRHNTRSPSRVLLNGHITYQLNDWSLQLWGRNMSNEDYFARGFGSFGNDPRKEYATEPYYQYAEPRMVGLTLTYTR